MKKSNNDIDKFIESGKVPDKKGFYTSSKVAEVASIVGGERSFYYDEENDRTEWWMSGHLLTFGVNNK